MTTAHYYPKPLAPDAYDNEIPKYSSKKNLNDYDFDLLHAQGYPKGLARSLVQSANEFSFRIWVVDNSGSMATPDGHRFVETKKSNEVKIVTCTRWVEIQETVIYHAELAALLHAPTIFRFLNPTAGVHQLAIGDKGDHMIDQDLQHIKKTIRTSKPMGCTPLSRHVREIRDYVQSMLPTLSSKGKRIAIILATDGLPSDDRGMSGITEQNEFIQSLKSLQGLPVWLVIRLCTDDDDTVDFYNCLDSQLELSIEVLDDFEAEAKEIHKYNKCVNYTLALHRCREMGYHDRLFDLLDERRLTLGELREFLFLLFGEEVFDGVPDPEADFDAFFKRISDMVSREKNQWNPIFKKSKSLIDLKALKHEYDDSASTCVLS